MANNSTGQSSFGFLSSAGFGMEERSGAMEGASLFGFDSKDVGDSVTEKGSHVVVATPLNVAAPGGMRWSPGTFADGIISVAGKEGKGEVPALQDGAAGGSGGSNDTLIGLELGKRTYFEVPGGGGGGGGGQAPSQAPPKKLRIAGQTPKCQVEGCKTDLTSAKDYHRRHKVCAIHSKAARVIVAGQEQRFCQQCSRFHGLTEFDEGKRSCRRRLAGHNERRRKPQPDTLAFNARFLPAFQDSRRLGHLYTDRSSFLPHVRIPGISALWDECDDLNSSQQKGAWPPRMLKYEDQSSFECSLPAGAGMERQLFLTGLQHPNDRPSLFPPQSPKGMIPVSNDVVGPKTHQYFQGSVDPLGQSLSLTSSSGAGVLSGLEAIPVCQGFTRVSDSGRALSLQSTMQLLSSTQASVAVSLDSTTPHSNIMSDQGLHNSKIPIAQPLVQGGQQHHFEWGNDKLLSAASSSHNMSTTGYPAGSNTIEKGLLEGPYTHGLNGIGSYECLPLYSMLQGEVRLGDLQQDVKPTIDLMQVASASHGQSTQPLVSSGFDMGISHFGDLQALRPYDSSIFSSQQM